MRVVIADEIFADPDASADLLELFLLSKGGRHSLLLARGSNTSFAHWRACGSLREQERVDMILKASLDRESKNPARFGVHICPAPTVNSAAEAEIELPLGEAMRLLRAPLRIIVEDEVHERAFLVAACNEHDRRRLLTAEQDQWLRFEHGGGGAMDRLFNPTHPASISGTLRKFRVFLMRDSDGYVPGHRSEQCEKFVRKCQDCGLDDPVRFHILERRFIESYLPREALDHWASDPDGSPNNKGVPDRTSVVDAWAMLSREQAAHYPMKNGFEGDDTALRALRKPTVECSDMDGLRVPTLYASLERGVFTKLRRGFHKHVSHHFADSAAWYHEHSSWRHRDGVAAELDRLLDLLLGAL